ncbi:ScyD/ScyE family protein [Actinoplanes flavus]|uniref:ScyD/ScyE family protein n=1 Tax=Actinoplanes flavus TaxID=2820290 RepID=A0ABS3UML3_9ACTN|nr:ScyD/ScyE family protein [Actinoplanes flavus]MBO3738887.1 ScyD/ScyE family protein [Actinoplanes flavus]
MFRSRPAVVVAVVGLVSSASPMRAAAPEPTVPARPGVEVVARGLDSPRGLAFGPRGELYIAEGGRGGPCRAETGGRLCSGRSGAITVAGFGRQWRVEAGLSSLASPAGAYALGPSDVTVSAEGDPVHTVRSGGGPALRSAPGRDGMARLDRRGTVLADLGAQATPADPVAVLATGQGYLVVDAAGDALLRVGRRGRVQTIATLPRRTPATEATSVAEGPDGAFYVGERAGREGRIWRIEPGRAPQMYASGLRGVVDLVWSPSGDLYVLDGAALLRLGGRGTRTVVTAGLTAPGGLALRGRDAYVSTCATCRGTGTVLRIRL